jgi:excisionase family DNA binding protein
MAISYRLQEKQTEREMSELERFLDGRPMVRQAELARALGVSPSFLSEMATRGDIRVKRVGRLVLIPREEVLRVFGVDTDEAA